MSDLGLNRRKRVWEHIDNRHGGSKVYLRRIMEGRGLIIAFCEVVDTTRWGTFKASGFRVSGFSGFRVIGCWGLVLIWEANTVDTKIEPAIRLARPKHTESYGYFSRLS